MYSPQLVTAPAIEPITLAEAKMHLRIDDTSPDVTPDNALISALVTASRQWAENYQNRAYITQEWDLFLDQFPAQDNYIILPRPPLQAVEALYYYDGAATQSVSFMDPSGSPLDESDIYIVDRASEPGRLWLKYGYIWPVINPQAKAVQIRFLAGHGDAASTVPEEIKAGIKLKLSDLYENRGDVEPGDRYEWAAKAILSLRRIVPI